MLTNLNKAPFPYWGGKRDAADAVWTALGDVVHYVEPFAGSLAVLLQRPHTLNRSYYSETVNDLDGFLVNLWRGIANDPEGVATHASYPVIEADIVARHLALLTWHNDQTIGRLMADPDYYDVKMAGWWVWGLSSWIGSGWCAGTGTWGVGEDGKLAKTSKGVRLNLPSITDDGRGVNHPGTRGQGVGLQLPALGNDGRGVIRPQLREQGLGDPHPMTMPELLRWMRFLSARLRHVRIANGGWERVCTSGAIKTLSVRMGGGVAGIFLDPPYDNNERTKGLYAHDSGHVATDVREWCKTNGNDPLYRIVLAGYDTEHTELESLGWRVVEWYKTGFLKGGMALQGGNSQQKRERLWLSPHCLNPSVDPGTLTMDDILGF